MSTPRYRSAPPSLSGSATSVVNATPPSSPGTKSSGIAVMGRFSHPASGSFLPVGSVGAVDPEGWGYHPRAGESEATRGLAGPDSEHLAAMRVEYSSAEKDGSRDLDADWLDDGWVVLLRKWID